MNNVYLQKRTLIALSACSSTFFVNAATLNSTWLAENSRWTIDASARVSRNTDTEKNAQTYALGLDFHKVFSDDSHDIGTLTFQPYLVKISNVARPPFTFDDGDDTELTWRIANFNYTALAQGKFNIRLGHFEIPYGLEYAEDTNGTLRQLTASDRGIKADWGISLNGILPYLEYEVALTRGSGNEIKSTDNPHVFSGRIGSPSHRNLITGISWFKGDVLTRNGVVERERYGVDVSYFYYQWQFMLESSLGETQGNDTSHSFAEIAWMSPQEHWKSYLQLVYQDIDVEQRNDFASYWIFGLRWQNDDGFDLSAQFKHDLNSASTIETAPDLSLQVRYRL
ncbi:MAG: hypothetical protein CL579_03120 [Alteromonadaceae bacterium]|nr:hypothetical protein [Alteromonadaceae bacterium]MBB18846.1 hypothetical protein [Rickettsiales bacterium]